jgi:alkanesulfonate monooxygenase SsuD/methylene tetrahydromethanopterin reductase-like flavin-dependent oxidoreductase (luciferase family)
MPRLTYEVALLDAASDGRAILEVATGPLTSGRIVERMIARFFIQSIVAYFRGRSEVSRKSFT